MDNNTRYSIGQEGFIWFMGVVEDRMDPDQLGRVRVRAFGWHSEDKTLIPTEALPWAMPLAAVNAPLVSHTPKEGDWVVGFFADGDSAQQPVILGVLSGAPKEPAKRDSGFHDPTGIYPKRLNESTLSRFIRGRQDGTVHELRSRSLKKGVKSIGTTWDEPAGTFAPQYPLNFSIESESGHALELDDTPGKERVHLAHKIGSFVEFDAAGNRVEKIVKDSYTIIAGSNFVVIDGACNVTVKGNCNLKVSGALAAEAKSISLNATDSVKIRAGGALKLEGKSVDVKASGAMKVGSGGKLSLKGKSTAVDGKSVTLGGKPSNKVKTKHGIGKILPTGSASSPSNTGLKAPS